MEPKQVDCFNINFMFWNILGIWPGGDMSRFYKFYSIIFVALFVITYDILLTINFYFMPRQLDVYIEQMLFYFMELAVLSKVLTYLLMRDKLQEIIDVFECDVFQPDADVLEIITNAKRFIKTFWKTVVAVCYAANTFHVLPPIIMHVFVHAELKLTISTYSFLPENIKDMLIYPLYFYQSIGMHFHMLYNVTIDTFFNGLIILTIAHLKVLDKTLRRLTESVNSKTEDTIKAMTETVIERESFFQYKLNKCIKLFAEIDKLCILIQNVFSLTLLVQVLMASCVICITLFRFTLPATPSYYFFLLNYTTAMVAEIMIPCWFGSQLMETSSALSLAVYSCNWTPRTSAFKSNLRLFVERMKKPLSLTGWKMFSLSLGTFTSIMNTAYSFFTVLRHMQSRES